MLFAKRGRFDDSSMTPFVVRGGAGTKRHGRWPCAPGPVQGIDNLFSRRGTSIKNDLYPALLTSETASDNRIRGAPSRLGTEGGVGSSPRIRPRNAMVGREVMVAHLEVTCAEWPHGPPETSGLCRERRWLMARPPRATPTSAHKASLIVRSGSPGC